MDSVDLDVLRSALEWRRQGHRVDLVTVIETWGSSPRPPGALLAVREDGQVVGSVSGGCVEDDLIERVRKAPLTSGKPALTVYGVTKEEAARFGLPCGGTLRLMQEPLGDTAWIAELIARTTEHEVLARVLDMETGRVTLSPAARDEQISFDGKVLRTIHGPRWRMLIIGAGQLSRYLATMAQTLDFNVTVCDPREEYSANWDVSGVTLSSAMPDDQVLAMQLDAHSAVVALTHDPKLDDMALLEALKSNAFYVGALGSRANTAKRKERLALFDLTPEEIGRLHGPVGLRIGSRTPPEIAISILAEIVAVKNAAAEREVPSEASSCAVA
ncbi:xanthine dehydrogenase accessory factor [Noviherbaspirillum humi]|uniref:Xanthine dehydrogenase accessory factor n=1 Tax=Noviherbaspirillum humi TaxID=1688639 RepID=A0A239IP30_9BURK|nr:XdhC family protein [Noviherbaspirillum humi]SNS94978.1 xanthine dehydrogenase accessory factor [Noviherbaspirillum humi]